MVLKVAAGLRSVQQQVNTGPDGGTFRAMTDKTALFPKGLQSQHGNARSSLTCLCVCVEYRDLCDGLLFTDVL